MTGGPDDRPNEHTDVNWLRRQIRRIDNVRRRDVVIGQVGEGARNVIIGKGNVQINIADRNVTLPAYAALLLLVVIASSLMIVVGFLSRPVWEPVLYPARMSKPFNIAVAQFGELDSDGHVQETETGRLLSTWLFDGLKREYANYAETEEGILADSIEIWHDSDSTTAQNFKFGVISGDTAQERRDAAARLAEKVGAHMVIYGNLAAEPAASGLNLEFYLSPLVNDETAAIVGSHRLGKLMPVRLPFDAGDPTANVAVSENLKVRSDALFWLTVGLTEQLLGRSEQALDTFRRAEQELTEWPEGDGKEILHFFIGREQFFLGQTDEAEASFRRALEIEPDYPRAQVALGSVYRRRAADIEAAERLEEPKYLEQAIEFHWRGLDLALNAGDPLVEAAARIALAKSLRLLGDTHALLGDVAEAHRQYEAVISETNQALSVLLGKRQHRLMAQAYEAQGAAYVQQGLLLEFQEEPAESQTQLQLAKTAYENCIAQGQAITHDDKILREEVIGRGCQPMYEQTVAILQGVDGDG